MTPVLVFGSAAICAVVFTAVVRGVAKRSRRFGMSGAPIPTLGGPAMLAAFFCVLLGASVSLPVGLIAGAAGMAAVGFVDDLWPLVPARKFVLTVVVASVAVGLNIRIHVTDIIWVDAVITVLWMVWMCHAFNVFDMADGLSSGAGAIGALSLWLMGAGDWMLGMAGALVGFLIHNFYPARIYMGDAGSLLFGFLLSATAVFVANDVGGWAGVVGPGIVLALPIFEAIFISAVRFAKGRPISRASRDHVAQRLVQWGRSMRVAVLMMWFVGAVLGGFGFLIVRGDLPAWLGMLVVLCVAFCIWHGLARVDMEGDGCDGRPVGFFSKNWMIHRLMRQAMAGVTEFVNGRLLDVGCGMRPYAAIFEEYVQDYVGLERDRGRYDRVDVWADVLALPFKD
ncbi:MAG: MraY family glycosyltransferase, partial [Candidatus Latescibacteria bacterium]|nr:MraY family glycosyltransferase [Candidatus Latescibacterota bacterium]